jgi:hypothetical protein
MSKDHAGRLGYGPVARRRRHPANKTHASQRPAVDWSPGRLAGEEA